MSEVRAVAAEFNRGLLPGLESHYYKHETDSTRHRQTGFPLSSV